MNTQATQAKLFLKYQQQFHKKVSQKAQKAYSKKVFFKAF